MKTLITSLAMVGMIGSASAVAVLVPNGDFETAGGISWSSFASTGTAISFPATGGNTGGYGVVDNTAGAWGGGLVSPADFEYPGNDGIPLSFFGASGGDDIVVSMDMINLLGTGIGGVKVESWGGGVFLQNHGGDTPASGQSSSWANYTWNVTLDAGADAIKIVPLLTPPTYGAGNGQSSIGFDNVSVNVIPEPSSVALLGLGGLALLRRRRR